MRTVGLFAGIGGLEEGLRRAGFDSSLLVELSPQAREVLRARFPSSEVHDDVREVDSIPGDTSLLVAGFPCQDLSSVGLKQGLSGDQSTLVSEVIRIVEQSRVPWLLLENVPFIRHLKGGEALGAIVAALERLGYAWAYRVVDSEAFGLPQRRRRWFLVASNQQDPSGVLLTGDTDRPPAPDWKDVACGFYWTEGMRALGWAVDAVPPLKCGSTIGVPSPPAIAMPSGAFVTPSLRDAERLQGFPSDWTIEAERVARASFRWQLVGNAVSVPVAEWVGRRIVEVSNGMSGAASQTIPTRGKGWPLAATGGPGSEQRSVELGVYPVWYPRPSLVEFLEFDGKPLSTRAAEGFLRRTRKGSLRFAEGFLENLETYVLAQRSAELDLLSA